MKEDQFKKVNPGFDYLSLQNQSGVSGQVHLSLMTPESARSSKIRSSCSRSRSLLSLRFLFYRDTKREYHSQVKSKNAHELCHCTIDQTTHSMLSKGFPQFPQSCIRTECIPQVSSQELLSLEDGVLPPAP